MIRSMDRTSGGNQSSRARLQARLNEVDFGTLTLASPDLETEIHRRALERFRDQVVTRLSSSPGPMQTDGLLTGDMFSRLQNLESRLNCVPQDDLEAEDFEASSGTLSSGSNQLANPSGDSPVSGGSSGLSRGTLSSGASVTAPLTVLDFIGLLALLIVLIGGPLWLYHRRNSASFKAREIRHLLSHSVEVRLGDTVLPVELVDLSMNGFKLRHDGQIIDTGRIEILLGQDWHSAHMRWRNDGFVGGNFSHPLPSAVMAEILNTSVDPSPREPADALA